MLPRLRHAWSTGIGFTTDTGPRVRAAYENRYINTRGHRLDSDAAVSSIRSRINLGYSIPLNDPLTTSLNFSTGYITEKTDTYDSDRFKLETAYRRESASGWLETWSINYLRDAYVINQQEDTSILTIPGYSLSRTSADDYINPSRGWRLFGQIRGATDAVISDTTFVQLYTSGKGIISVGPGRFITRFEFGTTWIDVAEELPVSLRYFAGGDQSIRGYDYQSLGPVNADDEVIGGKHLFAGSVEYDFPVKNNWRAALFYDGGNAFSSQKFDWKQSVGIGVRWISPIGPIRADLAHALNDEGGFRLHITMGPDL
jgi:translocation and assembly module TamA